MGERLTDLDARETSDRVSCAAELCGRAAVTSYSVVEGLVTGRPGVQ